MNELSFVVGRAPGCLRRVVVVSGVRRVSFAEDNAERLRLSTGPSLRGDGIPPQGKPNLNKF